MKYQTDAVDEILNQWKEECPELATAAMGTIGRLKRCSSLLQPKLEEVFSQFSINSWEFDVLATLKRAGAPYCLAPTDLFSSLMVTSGTMTHRMNQLEKRGLVQRTDNPNDGRSKFVQLTSEGHRLISSAVIEHLKNEEKLVSGMSKAERKQLDQLLRKFLSQLER